MVNLGLGALGLLILVGGPLGLFVLWYTRGRDVPVGPVADYLAKPPSDLPAGVVGTLLDEQADVKDIIASIVDLARRGAIKMVETKEKGFLGIGERRDYSFQLLDPDKVERPCEKTLIEELFHGRSKVKLSQLKEKFYKAIPTLKEQLYDEVVKEGFFRASPERYLANIEKYTNLQEAKDIFEKYLSYAITFGLERSWVSKFAAVDTPAPTWYGTYPLWDGDLS